MLDSAEKQGSEMQLDMYIQQGLEQKGELQNYVESKWGFLKNVININSFFSTDETNGDQTFPEAK